MNDCRHGIKSSSGHVRWFLLQHAGHPGDIFVAMEDAEKWTMEQDDVGDIIFFHRETQVGVKDRFICIRSVSSP